MLLYATTFLGRWKVWRFYCKS